MPMDWPCFFIGILGFSMVSSISEFTIAADFIALGRPIRDGETLVSSFKIFELGFFSRGSSNNRFLGIWYKNYTETVVWVANREKPITGTSGVLSISNDGNLVLSNQSDGTVWSTNVTVIVENPVAQLLDSGNFVLRSNLSGNNPESYKWQSFDYPSDTMLPGMKLGWDFKTGLQRYLTSWSSFDDPSPGDFTYKLDIEGLPQIVIRRGSTKIARTGLWNGVYFGALPTVDNLVFKPSAEFNEDEAYYTYQPASNSITMRLLLNQSGYLVRFLLNNGQTGWGSLYYMPLTACARYGECGANGICSMSTAPICRCLQGFVPKSQKEWQASNWTAGCVRSTQLDCQKEEGFVKLQGVKLPDLLDYSLNKSMSLSECEAACSRNCNCTAYTNSNITSGGSGCLMWFGDLVDIRFVAEDYSGQVLHIRLPGSHLDSSSDSSKKRKRKIAIAIPSVGAVLFILLGFCCVLRRNKARKRVGGGSSSFKTEGTNEDIELPLFDLSAIAAATNNFAGENVIGEGGFGPVYKGVLPTGEVIAVKRLSKNSGQGTEQFMNEVYFIAKLQHRNLVGLVGCCIQREERVLMYEFMPNKSLDTYIFDSQRSASLQWPNRFDIIIGIARGLLYLHRDSKLQIIHRDLKASNILLDGNLNPKISDFGLARISGEHDKEEITKKVVGTHGYMAPEYAIDGTISVKSDVFSFGVLVLEVVSGKKNRGFFHEEQQQNLVGHAWRLWSAGRALEIMDPCLKDSSVPSQVLRFIQVGLLCVQNFPEDRPPMSSVVFMLANDGATLPQPKRPGFFRERNSSTRDVNAISTSDDSFSTNTISITTVAGR